MIELLCSDPHVVVQMFQMFPVLGSCPTICALIETWHAQMELVILRQENAFAQEKCEPSGKMEVAHDVCIVSRISTPKHCHGLSKY